MSDSSTGPLARPQLELLGADPDLVARLEAGSFECRDDPDLAQALLEIGERLGVCEVVTRDQQLDPTPANPKRAVALRLDLEALRRIRPVGDVLGLECGLAVGAPDRLRLHAR